MKLPSEPRKGDPVWLTIIQIIRYLRAITIVGVVGGRKDETPSGTIIYPGNAARQSISKSSSRYTPWKPQFFSTGTAPAITYKCTINLGTVNNVAAGNWNAEHTLPSDDTIKFVVLTITTASGKVTGVSISIDSAPPTDDVIAKDTPPVTHKIVLGAIGKQSAQMIEEDNLQLTAVEVFRETVAAPATGAEPFSRWWRWHQDA